ncbi:MAG: hypothetical protein MUF86_09245 [Akkermansiaceae bacterium]|nr:hypothetical protein [Akkermansiaceae bacterium]
MTAAFLGDDAHGGLFVMWWIGGIERSEIDGSEHDVRRRRTAGRREQMRAFSSLTRGLV